MEVLISNADEKGAKGPSHLSVDASSSDNDRIEGQTTDDKEMERKLLLKRDFILLPTVGLLYMIVSTFTEAEHSQNNSVNADVP